MGADSITKDSTMQEILEVFPEAQRALFSRYHIGGCSSCGFQPTDTLEEVCHSHNIWDVHGVIRDLQQSHEQDHTLQISPEELAEALRSGATIHLLDVRTPEEHAVARIEGARLVTAALAQEVVEQWPKDAPIVVHCHVGQRSLEAAAFLIGRGFTKVKSLTGGIDAWSQRVDPTVPRYAGAPAHCK